MAPTERTHHNATDADLLEAVRDAKLYLEQVRYCINQGILASALDNVTHTGKNLHWLTLALNARVREMPAPPEPLRMLGVAPWLACEYNDVGNEVIRSGYVAHACLSDGTMSWPMGAPLRESFEQAAADCPYVEWTETGPVMNRAFFIREEALRQQV